MLFVNDTFVSKTVKPEQPSHGPPESMHPVHFSNNSQSCSKKCYTDKSLSTPYQLTV